MSFSVFGIAVLLMVGAAVHAGFPPWRPETSACILARQFPFRSASMSPSPGAAAPPSDAALFRAVAARYRGASRFTQGFVRSKLRTDPAVRAILGLAATRAFGHVADLGCGRGQLGLALLEAGLVDSLTGLDLDPGKIAEARAAAAGLPARFDVADLAATPVPDCDTALLVDVLYQLPEAAQHALLARVAAAARRRVLLRAFDPDRGWRSALAHGMERVRRALGGDRGRAAIRPLPVDSLAAPLRAAGFAVSVTPCWAGTPLPNVLLLAERKTA
jgi:SAM-dependent methyltransferase